MVVEDQRRRPGRSRASSGSGKVRYVGRDGDLGEAAEHAERGDPVARLDGGALRRAADDAADLAAGDERQRRLDLVLAAGLQHLGERDAGGVDVDDDPRRARA